jgi:hypothetical protein
MMETPPLPERHGELPELVLPEVHGMGGNTMVLKAQSVYTADQMREFGELCARMAREQERERCARICEERAGTVSMFANSKEAGAHNHAVRGCAAAIRAG